MAKVKILILFGESCAGKDYIQNWVVSNLPNTHKMVSCTTREKRSNEQEGVDYFFLTNDQFAEKVFNGEMLEASSYGGEFYGTSIDALDIDKINIGVMDIAGIEILMNSDFDVLPVYVAAMPKTRIARAINRDSKTPVSKICERFLEDEDKFSGIIPFDFETIINDSKLMEQDVFSQVEEIINNFGQK